MGHLIPIFCSNTIDNIYNTIDDLIKEFKYLPNDRYLIVGDFLFAFTPNDLRDPANIIFKTTRKNYLENICLRSFINESFGFNSDKYLLFHKKLLIGLRLLKILERIQIKSFQNNM